MQTNRLVIPAAEEILNSYFPVLDHGFVALKDYMGGDESIEESARVSYGNETRKVSDRRTLNRLLFRHKHWSPFEMAEYRFHIGLPIFIMRQWVRHRTANLNEYSGRYSVMPMLFYTPTNEQVCHQSKSNKQGRGEKLNEKAYGDFKRKLKFSRMTVALNYKEWVDEDDIARETARLDLPLSTYTYCYWKCDLRNLFNLMSLRSDSHAQWEIQQFSDVICGIIKRCAPIAFEAFQDYQQTAVTFSQIDLRALKTLVTMIPPSEWEQPPLEVKSVVKSNMIHSFGATNREVEEFFDKIKIKNKLDYSLDLTKAKTGEYFCDMVTNAAVEVPNTL